MKESLVLPIVGETTLINCCEKGSMLVKLQFSFKQIIGHTKNFKVLMFEESLESDPKYYFLEDP